jgi:hypothetical protein
MFTRILGNPLSSSALLFALLSITACGGQGEGLFGQNKSSRRGATDESRDNGSSAEDSGGLSLTMPAGHAQFAGVTNIEITIWAERYYIDNKPLIGSGSPSCDSQGTCSTPSYNPDDAIMGKPGFSAKPITRLVPYKPGEKANMSDIPTGPITVRVRLLDKVGNAQFIGWGSAQVVKGQTAATVVSVSPTPGTGSVDIIIQPENPIFYPSPESMPMPGGYQVIASTDSRVQAAAKFAMGKIKLAGGYTLKYVSQAALQVVAGLNLAFVMEIAYGSTTESFAVLVYQALDGTMTLVRKQALGASSAGSPP